MNIPIAITENHLWSVFSLLVIFFVISVATLIHHWNYYGIKGEKKIFAKSLYLIGSGFMLFIMTVLIIAY